MTVAYRVSSLARGSTVTGFDPAETYAALPPGYVLGELAQDPQGHVYRLYQARTARAIEPGAVLQVDSDDSNPFWFLVDESASKSNIPGGVAMSSPSRDHYAWAMVSGYHPAVLKTSNVSVTEGQFAQADDARDGGVTESSATFNIRTFGYIQRTRAGTTTTCEVMIRGLI